MRFFVFCPISETELTRRLGTAEYSYRFVLQGFCKVLERLGEVIEVSDPARDADRLFDEGRADGHTCRLLCFCPPNQAPVGLRCPTTVVLAWEFDSIPCETWEGDPRNDWRSVLAAHGQAITLSRHSREVIQQTPGTNCRTTAVPVPMIPRLLSDGTGTGRLPRAVELCFNGHITDSRTLVYSEAGCLPEDLTAIRTGTLNGTPHTFSFAGDEAGVGLIGFYDPEPWGVWSRTSQPMLLLPFLLTGRVQLSLTTVAYGRNIGRRVDLIVGDQRFPIVLTETPTTHQLRLHPGRKAVNHVRIDSLDVDPIPDAPDPRTMGIGLVQLQLTRPRPRLPHWCRLESAEEPRACVELSGVVFTSVLNPRDGRKNWEDMVSGFAYALGDCADATLVLKTTHAWPSAYLEPFLNLMTAIGPVRARMVVVHGFLDLDVYRQLIEATSWYVNTSRGEGLCLPLMEFMSAGVPAIAPCHTAMEEYVDPSSTLVVRSSLTPTQWPKDPSMRLRTRWHQIDWQCLVDQYRKGYDIAKNQPQRYAGMSGAAASAIARHAGVDRVKALLLDHFQEAR